MARGHDVSKKAIGSTPAKKASELFGSTSAYTVRFARLFLVVIALVSVGFSGCSRCRLPAIDPTGNRLFAGSTNLTLPGVHATPQNVGIIPQPGFREPPPPPACITGPSIVPTARPVGHKLFPGHNRQQPDDRGRCGQLLLTPTRIVAPVNGDVVLLCGICGEDGYLVTGEPIEWMIAPDSVGQIIEVGNDGTNTTSKTAARNGASEVEKLGIDYARGLTARAEKIITRGSAKVTDDLLVKKGQTWVSLTSPTEGITRITALAPDAEVWDKRRQTASIYWVDARWQFPAPQNALGTAPANLLTRVTRSEGFAPAEGWIVRYTSLDPNLALFTRTNSAVEEVIVDSNGNAATQVNNVTGRSATALIAIEVERPAQASENMPKLTIASNQTTVSWSAPQLLLDARGPQSGGVNEVLHYTVNLSNFGNMPAENTRLTVGIPAGMSVVAFDPPLIQGQQSNTAIAWDLGSIRSREGINFSVDLRANAESDYRVQFEATSSAVGPIRKDVSTLVTSPQIQLKYVPGQGSQQVEVGSLVVTDLTVTNVGRSSVSNLEIVIQPDAGLQSIHDGGTAINAYIDYLAPGQSYPLDAKFIARQTGNLSATAIAKINQVEIARQTTSVVVVANTPREPKLSLQFQTASGSTQIAANTPTTIGLVVVNNGQVVLDNIQINLGYSGSLEPTSASKGFTRQDAQLQLVGVIPQLDPGNSTVVQVVFVADGREAVPRITAVAQCAPQVRTDAALDLQVGGGSGPISPPGNVTPPGNVLPDTSVLPPSTGGTNVLPGNSSGGLSVNLEPVRSEVRVNAPLRYLLTVKNNTPNADQNVEIYLQIPAGLDIREVSAEQGRRVQPEYATNGTSARLETVRYLGANETLGYYIEVSHRVTGTLTLQANVRSTRNPGYASATGTATVTP